MSDAFEPESAFDPLTIADVLNAKHTAAVVGFEDARATPPASVVAVEETATLGEALDELSLSSIKSVPVRARATGTVLGFFDATIALREALRAAGDGDLERLVMAKRVNDLIHPALVSGRRGDGGQLPFACADLPLRELMSEHGYLLYERHSEDPVATGGSWWFNAEVHRLAIVDAQALRTTSSAASDDLDLDTVVSGARLRTQPTSPPNLKWEEIVDVVSQMDVVRCLVDTLDRRRRDDPPTLLSRAMSEPATTHASRPFCTFPDAPVGAVFAEMLAKGHSAAVVVRARKHTMEHAGDVSLWRAEDTLSVGDFASERVRDPSLLRGVGDGGATVAEFLARARGHPRHRMDAVGESATVFDAARMMTNAREHRAWIVDERDAPVGCVTCTDVLRCVAAARLEETTPRPNPPARVAPLVEEVEAPAPRQGAWA